jgi:hypothetical protein
MLSQHLYSSQEFRRTRNPFDKNKKEKRGEWFFLFGLCHYVTLKLSTAGGRIPLADSEEGNPPPLTKYLLWLRGTFVLTEFSGKIPKILRNSQSEFLKC